MKKARIYVLQNVNLLNIYPQKPKQKLGHFCTIVYSEILHFARVRRQINTFASSTNI